MQERFVLVLAALSACTLETDSLGPGESGDAGPPVAHTHDWSELTGPASGRVGLGTTEPGAQLDLKGTLSEPLSGTVSVAKDSTEVTGGATLFADALAVGDPIKIGDEVHTVAAIAADGRSPSAAVRRAARWHLWAGIAAQGSPPPSWLRRMAATSGSSCYP